MTRDYKLCCCISGWICRQWAAWYQVPRQYHQATRRHHLSPAWLWGRVCEWPILRARWPCEVRRTFLWAVVTAHQHRYVPLLST